MTFRQLSKFTLGISAILVVVSVALFIYPGPKYSIEFTGGTLMEVQPPADKTRGDIIAALDGYESKDLGNFQVTAVQSAGQGAFVLRLPTMTNEEHLALLTYLETTLGKTTELRYTTIGPSLSASLKVKSIQAIAIASVAVIIYLAIAFRKLPRKLNPWKFGSIVVLAFLHDIVITVGVFVIIGWFTAFEFDTLFVTALLTILAYSTNEAIVVFDRIRANLSFDNRNEDLTKVISTALKQCIGRTTGTTVSILIMLTTLFFLGAESIRWFIFALIFGAVIGAYSSYLVAAPLLMYWQDKSK